MCAESFDMHGDNSLLFAIKRANNRTDIQNEFALACEAHGTPTGYKYKQLQE